MNSANTRQDNQTPFSVEDIAAIRRIFSNPQAHDLLKDLQESMEPVAEGDHCAHVAEYTKSRVLSNIENSEEVQYYNRLQKAGKELQKILNPEKNVDPLLDHEYFQSDRRKTRFGATAQYMGIPPNAKRLPDGQSREEFYYGWIAKKLGYSSEEALAKVNEKEKQGYSHEKALQESVEELDKEMMEHMQESIDFIKEYEALLGENVSTSAFRSEYFSEIHSGKLTIRDYFSLWQQLEELITSDPENVDLIYLSQLAQWEIQRVLAVAMRFRNTDRTPEAVLHRLDDTVLTDKLKGLFVVPENRPEAPKNFDSLLYRETNTHFRYWKSSGEGKYELSDTPKIGFNKLKLEGGTLQGKLNPGHSDLRRISFDLEHIQIRPRKARRSAVEKGLRKPGVELLDHTGMIVVLKNFKKATSFMDMLACELSIMAGAYVERLDSVGNNQTDSSYKCKKCIFRIPHGFKNIKQNLNQGSEIFDRIISNMGADAWSAQDIEVFRGIFDGIKESINELDRDLQVEVQIFDLPSYIAAEQDKESPAHHDYYKRRQRFLEVLPILFPTPPYDRETIARAYMKELAKKYNVKEKDIPLNV